MSSQGGLKHVATEPAQLESKRDRRRGAAGRAAVLRRAPSDSDCSGETASLSADSGDRAVRPVPTPTRTGKTRSRRRGSEWEVLEGLKDGQRFEKRPEVFNGYLHKKRKWPLKGWHKRFFVVDGGILVYARSPTDVARGRLHGSVDVGLSVISAKARRRRIDIDADEFIYHLRAKTPDVFRTWLNVLKAHRLYRQHLLTFGARESVPKIHAPADDLPPTDTSSRTSKSSVESILSIYSNEQQSPLIVRNQSALSPSLTNISFMDPKSSYYGNTNPTLIKGWCKIFAEKSKLMPLRFESFDKLDTMELNDTPSNIESSLDSKDYVVESNDKPVTDAEKQIVCTDLYYTEKNRSVAISKWSLGDNNDFLCGHDIDKEKIKRKVSPTPTFFFFSRKNKNSIETRDEFIMKTSRKSTDLVKYKNVLIEPPLKNSISKCVLLKKNKFRAKNSSFYTPRPCSDAVVKPKYTNEVQVKIDKQTRDKSSQDKMTEDEYDQITERLLVSIFAQKSVLDFKQEQSVKYCINEVVKELCDVKITHINLHPVKTLFRCLLQFWLQHTRVKTINFFVKSVNSVHTQSKKCLTKDQNLSSIYISNVHKATQFYGISGSNNKHIKYRKFYNKIKMIRDKPHTSTKIYSELSDEREKRIQELERLLKNTVYMCETMRENRNKETDIKITKKLIDNFTQLSENNFKSTGHDESSISSSKVPKVHEAINNLISDTLIPSKIAKDFLSAYLDVLQCESDEITSDSSGTSLYSESCNSIVDYDLQTDSRQDEQLSKSVTKLNNLSCDKSEKFQSQSTDLKIIDNVEEQDDKMISTDPGQLYIKDMLDKVTTIYKKVNKIDSQLWCKNRCKTQSKCEGTEIDDDVRDELGTRIKGYSNNKFILENRVENTVVINLSKYQLEHISLENNPVDNGITSITIKLQEKAFDFGEAKRTNLNLKFSDDRLKLMSKLNERCALPRTLDTIRSKSTYNIVNRSAYDQNDKICFNINTGDETKIRKGLHEIHDGLVNYSFNSSKLFRTSFEEFDRQSCFVMSFKNTGFINKFQPKKVKIEGNDKKITHVQIHSPNKSTNEEVEKKYAQSVSLFDQPHPKNIDEKFILLLMENLTLLSKNVPGIYKDINNLYLKLKKKHDKMLKDNSTGLSLLGKIYNEHFKRPTNDLEVQCECGKIALIHKEVQYEVDEGFVEKSFTDQSLSAYKFSKHVCDCGEQTEDAHFKNKIVNTINEKIEYPFTCPYSFDIDKESHHTKGEVFNDCIVCITKSTTDKKKINEGVTFDSVKGTPIENCDKPGKRDCAMSTIFKYFISNNFTTLIPVKENIKENNSSGDDNSRENFTVFPLFVSNNHFATKSNSAIASNIRLKNNNEDLNTIYRCISEPSITSGIVSPTCPIRGPQAGFVTGTPGGRLASWIIESGGPLENASRELGQAQLSVQQLQRLLDALELQQQVHHDTDVSLEGASPNVKKDRRKFGLRKKKSSTKCASVELAPFSHIDPSSSHTALSTLAAPPSPGGGASSAPNSAASLPMACAATRPQSLPGAESLGATHSTGGPTSLTSLTPDHQLREDFTVLAKDLLGSLKGIVATLVCERGRLRAAMEAADTTTTAGGPMMAALRTNLSSALQQNSELRSRLSRIHDASDLADISSVGHNGDSVNRQFQQSLSYSSSCVSASEFFDAEEHDEEKENQIIAADEAGVIELDGDSSSEAGSLSSEEGSASSDNSDALSAEPVTLRVANGAEGTEGSGVEGTAGWSRRTRLPCPRPNPGGPSLWNLLYKNIGKDLSQISMPVTINEPLNMLQRLCEELEYSELLDAAANCASGVERMALISAFAVSAYASSAHRAASKPFNPLLAETYECVRSDRGFRFVAEQVSHHPPISACHAESSRWLFWQEARIKTKFWGKSMEFQPTGRVHVKLLTTGDHYTWNKVTTCVHNLFGGQRWVDQYGDMHITCRGTDISCKLNFIKASSWSSSRHEVRGAVTGPGGARLRLHGRWSEALYAGEPPAARCLWRPGTMPPEHEMYYGFTRFAMELNEIEPSMRDVLPHTDTRLRPDQRALEEGDVESAEHLKHQLEQAQRERRRGSPEHIPAWFRKSNECTESGSEDEWVFGREYWSCRDAGFPSPRAPALW